MVDKSLASRHGAPARFAEAAAARFSLICAILIGSSIVAPLLSQTTIRIGTAVDGPSRLDLAFRQAVQEELTKLAGNRFSLAFPADRQLVADWTVERAARNVDALLADPQVDAVIALGWAGPAYVVSLSNLPKTVVAAVIADSETQGAPIEVRERTAGGGAVTERIRVSGVPNLSYISFNLKPGREIEAYREIVPFTRLTFVTQWALEGPWLSPFRSRIEDGFRAIGVETRFVDAELSVDAVLAALPSDTQAVLLDWLPQLDEGEFDQLIQGLTDRKIPSFTLVGQRHVQRGALAGLNRNRNEQRLARRVALNLFNILLGEDAAALPVDFELDQQLMINLETARAIGVDPRYSVLTEAELIGQGRGQAARTLSLPATMREAERVNLDLLASERAVEAGLQTVRVARSNLLPQLSASGASSFIDRDRSSLFQPQRQVSGSVGLNQLIYSEEARSGFDIERHQQDSRVEERAQLRLDVLVDAAVSYLEVLRAKTVERIQRNNLRLTRSNLDLAQARLDLGASGREEVLRWRNQIAVDRRRVIDAGAGLGQAELLVNRLLNRPLEERFETLEVGLDDPELALSFERLGPYIESPGRFDVFRSFMTEYAWDASPEIRRLDAAVRGAERSLSAAKRAFYIPTVSLQAQARTFENGGAGSDDPLGSIDRLEWMIGVNATLPIFEGGALRARRTRAQLELDRLRLDRDATRLLIGQSIQSALFQAGASYAGIALARDAAQAAQENLQLVRENYSEGQVDILRLLDAQTQALSADLDAANAIFNHLIDLMRVQRAAGRFDYFRSVSDRNEFLQEVAEFFRSQGLPARNP